MKTLILGPVASGKSTLARNLSKECSIPSFELDKIVHDDEKKIKREEQEQRKIINKIIRENKEWIIEGMPRTHLEVLSSAATTILYLDISKKKLRKNLFLRHLKIKLGLLKVGYKADKKLYKMMLEYIEKENYEDRKFVMTKYPSKIIILKNKKEIKKFYDAMREGEIIKYQ